MNIHYLQHVPFENPGIILEWITKNQHQVSCTKLYEDHSFPELKEFDFLIIMGGPMNIYEEDVYPWLKTEKEFIRKAICDNKLILGLCLGAQLIADVIGGHVIKNPCKEIGWFPVNFTEEVRDFPLFAHLPENPMVFEWHGDTFVDLPKDTHFLAYNEACQNQAFAYGSRIYGFQFHLENTWEIILNLMTYCEEEMIPDQYVQSKEEVTAGQCFIKQDNEWMISFLSKLQQLYEEGEI